MATSIDKEILIFHAVLHECLKKYHPSRPESFKSIFDKNQKVRVVLLKIKIFSLTAQKVIFQKFFEY